MSHSSSFSLCPVCSGESAQRGLAEPRVIWNEAKTWSPQRPGEGDTRLSLSCGISLICVCISALTLIHYAILSSSIRVSVFFY